MSRMTKRPSDQVARIEAGYADTQQAPQRKASDDDCDPLEGIILREPIGAAIEQL